MADLVEVSEWTPGIYQLETTDPVEGGPDGVDNLQARQLANRTAYLKASLTALGEGTQPLDATLTALAAITTVADKLIYATGADAFATTTLTAFARTLLDDADAAAARATLGIVAGSETAAGLLELATAAETVTGTDSVRATHAAGVKAAIDAAITALVNGSPTALNQLNELATALGNDPNFATTITTALASKQPLDATLTSLAAMATAANQLIYATGSDTFGTTALTAFARTLLDDADAATARATLGLGAAALLAVGTSSGTVAAGDHNHGSTYQPLDATLTALAAMATAANQLI
ncbi:MAG: hypothetical protein OEL57_02450, partial [Trichlorobacter sp.]|uniref:hypothetical protein n=1 Tax=Trichlorobacter sp. TaxID=2911007 RepID=UPI0025667B6A|nr:hypothetical protein [Trichlorobacter sp.]